MPLQRPRGALALLIPLGLLLAGAWVWATSWQTLRAEMPTLAARGTLAEWQADSRSAPARSQWQAVEQSLKEGLQVQPDNPGLLEAWADLHQLGSAQTWANPEERQRLLAMAEAGFRQILKLQPSDARNWVALMVTLQLRGERGAVVNQAWAQARRYGPNEAYLVELQLQTVLRTWADASPDMRSWAADLFETGTQSQRDQINQMAKPLGLLFSSESAPRQTAAR